MGESFTLMPAPNQHYAADIYFSLRKSCNNSGDPFIVTLITSRFEFVSLSLLTTKL